MQQYLDDLDTLTATIINTHPSPHEFTPETEFWATVNRHKTSINEQTTYPEFIWMISEIVANIDCAHSSLGWFNQESQVLPIERYFPIEAQFIGDKLYVSDPLINKDQVKPESEIVSINNKPIAAIREAIYPHINSQGNNETFKRIIANAYITTYIPYVLDFPTQFTIKIKGQRSPISLKSLAEWSPKPRVHPNDPCQDNFCLQFKDNNQTAILTIRSFDFYGNRFHIYTDFIDSSFKTIQEKGATNLVLDLRMNSGGPSDAGIYLLRYISPKTFTFFSDAAFGEKMEPIAPFEHRFKGKTYTLMDGNCGSTTTQFLSLFKHLELGPLIGEEADGNQLCFGGQKRFQLPNTGINYMVGRFKYVTTATEFPEDQGLAPDHEVIQPIGDFIDGKDTVMEYVLKLIGED